MESMALEPSGLSPDGTSEQMDAQTTELTAAIR